MMTTATAEKKKRATDASPQPYVAKLDRVREIVSETLRLTGDLLYELTGLLVELLEDDAYRVKLVDRFPDQAIDDARLIDHFDAEYMGEIRELFGLGFAELRLVRERFPDRGDWTGRAVTQLWTEASRKPQQPDTSPVARKRATIQQVEELEQKASGLETEVAKVSRQRQRAADELVEQGAQIVSLKERIGVLEDRIAELETENARLKARLNQG